MLNKYLKLAFIVCGILSGLWLSCRVIRPMAIEHELVTTMHSSVYFCTTLIAQGAAFFVPRWPWLPSLLVKTISQLNINGLKNISRSKYKQDTIVTHGVWGNGVLLKGKIMSQNKAWHKQIGFSYLKYLLMWNELRILLCPYLPLSSYFKNSVNV